MRKKNRLYFCALFVFTSLQPYSWAEQFKEQGYAEVIDTQHNSGAFDLLYKQFDDFIEFMQEHPKWVEKLYIAKERFLRSKQKNYYMTDVFGWYDESQKIGRSQISFYYSVHFHKSMVTQYPEINKIAQIADFLESCYLIQQSYHPIFNQAATDLGIESIFVSDYGCPPILFKVIKYLPTYQVFKPHYDGTAFSLFLDSTDRESLLLSCYGSLLKIEDFFVPHRKFQRGDDQNSMLIIPGTLLQEFGIYPTPHIVIPSGQIRYAAIAFAMRPHYISQPYEFSVLPSFKY